MTLPITHVLTRCSVHAQPTHDGASWPPSSLLHCFPLVIVLTWCGCPSWCAQLNRLPNRAQYDKDVVHSILDEALYCTVSYVEGGTVPVTIPTNFVRIGEDVYVHGKGSAAFIRAMSAGQVCLTFTLLDGLVLARSAFHHSINYRSAVMFGTGEEVRYGLAGG